jgi:hypothetical protein
LTRTPDIAGHAVAGNAALSICESLLLALRDRKVLSDGDIRNVLERAAAAQYEASKTSEDPRHHRKAAELIERMIMGRTPFSPAFDESGRLTNPS